jgi:hypothetical protein
MCAAWRASLPATTAGHHDAVGEEAAEGEETDLIGSAQRTDQAFHAHQIADHPVGIAIALQLLQGVAPQLLSAIKGVDQHA